MSNITTCEFCKKVFSHQGNLLKHQQSTKFCLKIQKEKGYQNKNIHTYFCTFCNKDFTTKQYLNKHLDECISKHKQIIEDKEEEIYEKQEELDKANIKIIELQTEIRLILGKYGIPLQNEKDELILNMINKYVKKQPRKKIEDINVVYILTTPYLKKDRRYILGKAKNFTNRLSTYNKTDEHEIIFYQPCKEEEIMNVLEPLVFKKLNEYREQANRERFILPENKDIDFFINTIKNCFEFVSE